MKRKILFRDFINNNEMKELPQGKEATFRPSTYGIIKHENKFLLIKDGRSGEWEFPGGGVDIGETYDEAITREIKEESGYTVTCEHLPIHFDSDFIYHAQRDAYFQTIGLFFVGKLSSIEQSELNLDSPDEITEVKWVSLDELDKNPLIPYHKIALEVYLKNE